LTSYAAVAISRIILLHVVGGADNDFRHYNLILSQRKMLRISKLAQNSPINTRGIM
jgi:hypothetical protein